MDISVRAVERYLTLRRELPRFGKMALAIAAIALEYGGIEVTHHRRDFEQVLDLQILQPQIKR